MTRIYFSHSYRDRDVNEYFLQLFAEHQVNLVADRKSKVLCLPKLEKYMNESDGFVAVVPQRRTEEGTLTVSPYIAQEIRMARRAGLPSLIMADEMLLTRLRHAFPGESVPFRRDAPPSDEADHRRAIARFCAELESVPAVRSDRSGLRRASIFLGPAAVDLGIVKPLVELLETYAYESHLLRLGDLFDCANDLSALEPLWASEFAMFWLERDLSGVDLALALAHALAKPAFRLRHDPTGWSREPDSNGVLRWCRPEELLSVLQEQLESYRRGFLEVVLRDPGKVLSELEPDWDPCDPLSLVEFVRVEDSHLRNDRYGILKRLGKGAPDLIAEGGYEDLWRAAYEQIQSHEWLYDFEPGSKDYSRQRVRRPQQMNADRVGTCLDFACLFAALLESMQANPVIVRLGTDSGAHALAGSWVKNRSSTPLLRDDRLIRELVRRGDVMLVETTGAARASHDVAGEERGPDGFVSFGAAQAAAMRLLERDDLQFDFLLDVLAVRQC